jgi:hypothetical protein
VQLSQQSTNNTTLVLNKNNMYVQTEEHNATRMNCNKKAYMYLQAKQRSHFKMHFQGITDTVSKQQQSTHTHIR